MLLFFALVAPATAEPCALVADVVDQGWALFYDAELEQAKASVARAHELLSCQDQPVPTEQLLHLYRLDAISAVALGDQKGSIYATIRAVVADPDAVPPAELGPDLAELHRTWSSRLRESTVQVSVDGADSAWIDGQEVTPLQPLVILQGEHLVQLLTEEGWSTEVREVAADLVLDTLGESPVTSLEDPPEEDLPPVEEPPAELAPPQVQRPGRGRRVRRAALLSTGGLVAAGGGTALAWAWSEEQAFLERSYTPDAFGGCDRDMPCYSAAREERIHGDADAINQLYLIGYGLVGVGALVLGTELVLLPAPGGVSLRGAW